MSRIIENPKQLILNRAEEILYNEGYIKLNMRYLSKSCDIALGTIYNYYPTKKELVIEMMTDYWKQYFYKLEAIVNSDDVLYAKLSKIFNELSIFITSFKDVWLKPKLYDTPDYIESGLEKENIFMEKFIIIVENILLKEISNNNIRIKLNSYETAKFIVMNFITMVQMPIFKYSSFEIILKELFN